MDSLNFIMAYESGDMSLEDVVEGFQHLIDSGLVWRLQGSYQRASTSPYIISFDVLAVTIIVKGGLWVALTSGTGAAFGMVAAIKCHDRLFKK